MKAFEAKEKLDEFISELKYCEKSENTLRKYRSDILKFFDYINHDEEVLSKQKVMDYKAFICNSNKYKTSSINSYLIALNKFLKWAGLSDLTVKVIKQQRKSSLEDVISLIDYKRLLRFSKKMGMNDMYYIIRILGSTGIRIDELKFFTVENLKSNYIQVNNKGKEREITVPQELRRVLAKYCKANCIKSGVIFPGKIKGKIINKSTIWRRMKKVAGVARVNKNKVHAHSFRHLFAKEFMKKYNNSIELADILGHNSLETTRIYTRSTSLEKRMKIDALDF